MQRTSRDRRSALLLALMLVVGSAAPGPAAASSITGRGATGDSLATMGPSGSTTATIVAEQPADRPVDVGGFVSVGQFEARLADLEAVAASRVAEATAAAEAARIAEAAAAAKAATAKAAAVAKAPAYVGKNHLWIPSLGLSRVVEGFSCTRSTPPANRVYRWGCAGTNNVYLFGHAWGVMKPLHDGYVAGKVKIGMVAKFADANGKVTTYRVTEIRVVTPDQVDWAIASQPVASMTLQTCLGANSDHRLLVRLVADK